MMAIELFLSVALAAGAAGAAVAPRSGIEAQVEREAAEKAEKAADWDAALLHYENIYDSTPTTQKERESLRKKFAELRPKAKPNEDPARAGVWKVKAYVFRSLDFRWRDASGKDRRAKHTYRDEEIQVIRQGMMGFQDLVWKHSSGNLRIVWDLTVLEKTLAKLDGRDAFWPGPGACMPHLTGLKPNEADSIMIFAKTGGNEKDHGDSIPLLLLGGMYPVLPGTQGATYIAFNWGEGACAHEPAGEPMLHEWLHAVQWTLEERQRYSKDLMFTPDGGRMEGQEGGDPCYRRKPSEPSWMGLYVHLMRDHVTRRMWRDLSLSGK